MTAATIGCFVLWFGWFGFNPGSTMAVDADAIAEIAVTTNMAAAAATLTRDAHCLAAARQARPRHDAQRLPGRPGRDHRPVCLRHRRRVASSSARSPACWSCSRSWSSTRSRSTTRSAPPRCTWSTACSARSASACSPRPTASPAAGNAEHEGRPVLRRRHGAADRPAHRHRLHAPSTCCVVAGIAWVVLKSTIGIRVSRRRGDRRPGHRRARQRGLPRLRARPRVADRRRRAQGRHGPAGRQALRHRRGRRQQRRAAARLVGHVPAGQGADPDFKEVYSNMTTVQGNRFHFRGGDPEG